MTSALNAALLYQARACEGLDSPFMGRLLRMLAAHWPTDTALAAKCAAWQGDIGPLAASLPLRIAGGLHALVLQNIDPDLTAAYPPNDATDSQLWAALDHALHSQDAFLCNWIEHAPQTNEVRRAAVLIAATQLLADRFDMPTRLTELGPSAGLNLMFDRFSLELNGTSFGAPGDVHLTPDWTGPLPPQADLNIADRRGVDLNPLDAHDPDDQLRLLAYLWPDQSERLSRTRTAISLQDAKLDKGDAIQWLESHLSAVPGTMHLIYHTIA